jgi:hypothetical protein
MNYSPIDCFDCLQDSYEYQALFEKARLLQLMEFTAVDP